MEEKKSAAVSHEGHRQRMKERYLTGGLAGFSGHEVLELLLFYGLPYKDTNELAHTIESSFGGLANVLEAEYADLLQVKGVTPHVATLICLCGDIGRRYYAEVSGRVTHLYDTESLANYIKPMFLGQREESVVLVSMDNKRKLLNATRIFKGSVTSAQFSLRMAVQQALRDNATRVALAHNHPLGYAFPSKADLEVTKRFRETLEPLDIRLVDHLIVSENECLSLCHLEETKSLFSE